MYFHDDMYSEPIQTVNAEVVGVYSTHAKADKAAKRYFTQTLGLSDNGESENGGYYCAAHDMEDFHSGTWDEEIYVQSRTTQ